jgi:hypothetical protein
MGDGTPCAARITPQLRMDDLDNSPSRDVGSRTDERTLVYNTCIDKGASPRGS